MDRRNDYDNMLDGSIPNATAAAASSSSAHTGSHHYPRYQLHPSPSQGSFDMTPPGLIRDGEEGYASLPQSPLDAVFPGSVALGSALGAGAGPLDGVCKNYVDVGFTGSAAACQFDGAGVPAPLAGAGAAAGYGAALPDNLSHSAHQSYVSCCPSVRGDDRVG